MAFEKGNEYGKTTSRKGVKNKVNLEIKESIKLIIENNLEQLQSDLDSLKANANSSFFAFSVSPAKWLTKNTEARESASVEGNIM